MSSMPAPAAGPVQTATLDMLRSVLMAAGSPFLVKGIVTGDEWSAIAGGAVALVSAAWSYAAAHPGKTPPLQALRALVKRGGQGPAWDAEVAALERILVPIIARAVDAQIKAHAGLLAGPADALANRAVQSGADRLAGQLEIR